MQIDRIRKRLKNSEKQGDRMIYSEGAAALHTMIETLDGATAFEVSPLLAFILALMKKDTFETFMQTVESSNLGTMQPLYGLKEQGLQSVMRQAECRPSDRF